ncbi:hypothetical protein [Hymenobacter edaphi]|uniref:Uncharacterized protein n=1 Tax=Hymenobacter edaphi TaxID=2211146 RepID=A0A328BKI5_9BACT|nr:hypothetical protein [Hymenobacter edaphi]RAK67139.1 hypothetical protein DLM85_13160 [Hymenobacter edaphi]
MEKLRRSNYDIWASTLLLVSWAFSIAYAGYAGIHMFNPDLPWLSRGLYVLVYGFLAAMYYYQRSGDRNSKLWFLLLMGVVFYQGLSAYQQTEGFHFQDTLRAGLYAATKLFELAGTLLLIVSLIRDWKAKA